jgi:hypothetical protein
MRWHTRRVWSILASELGRSNVQSVLIEVRVDVTVYQLTGRLSFARITRRCRIGRQLQEAIGEFMAKKANKARGMIERGRRGTVPATRALAGGVSERIEGFADDLGRLLEDARAKAEGWLGQRQALGAHLTEIRDTASELLGKLGGGGAAAPRGPARRRAATSGGRRTGRPRKAAADTPQLAAGGPRKRTMSPEARKAISDAQKARWARQRRAARTAR